MRYRLLSFTFVSDGATYPDQADVEELYDGTRRPLGDLGYDDCERLVRACGSDAGILRHGLGRLGYDIPGAETARELVRRGAQLLMEKIEQGVDEELKLGMW